MSHNVTLQNVKIADISAVRQAVTELSKERNINMVFQEKGKIRGYGGRESDVCDYVVRMSDHRYDLGLNKQADGTYSLRTESDASYDYGKDIGALAGSRTVDGKACSVRGPHAAVGQLLQRVNVIVAEKEAVQKGLTTARQMDDKTKVMALVVDIPDKASAGGGYGG